jgi:hypothetical protein
MFGIDFEMKWALSRKMNEIAYYDPYISLPQTSPTPPENVSQHPDPTSTISDPNLSVLQFSLDHFLPLDSRNTIICPVHDSK